MDSPAETRREETREEVRLWKTVRFLQALGDRYTYRPIANSYVRFGLLLGLPGMFLTLAATIACSASTVPLAERFLAALRNPLLLAASASYPLLACWAFGVLGTLSRGKDLRIAQLIRDLTLQASRDELTGLLNHRHVVEHLGIEIERARREGYPLACLMIDLDNLKPVNDVFGHLAGDRILMEVGAILREGCRPYDVAGRYGGDEFCLVLPRVSDLQAAQMAERIRGRVARHPFVLPWNNRAVRPTVSIGISSFPRDGGTRAALVSAADSALYEAKEAGKNRVVIATGLRPVEGGRATKRTDTPRSLEARVFPRDPRPASQGPGRGPGAETGDGRELEARAPVETRRMAGHTPSPSRGERLLLIDDDPEIADMVRSLLEGEGYKVQVAPDGLAALEALASATPDLILLDLAMPRMDGFDFCRALSERGLARGVPIVVLTALDTFGYSSEFLSSLFGVRLFMYKPFQPRALLENLRKVLAVQRARNS
ncbi:MAG: diguanylate cyclase [Planctomycetes bacterium]|nr:diguanylate cyclase [Planctomycetota bacterium]